MFLVRHHTRGSISSLLVLYNVNTPIWATHYCTYAVVWAKWFSVPTILYDCETWILSESHLSTLESFQAEIWKRILGLLKHHSNLSTLIALHWLSIRCRILIRNLGYLTKLLSNNDKLSAQVIHTLASEDVYNVSLIQQRCSLEQHLGCNHVQLYIHDPSVAHLTIQDAKNEIIANTSPSPFT